MVGGAGYVAQLMLPKLAEVHEIRVLDPRRPAFDCDYVAGSASNLGDLAGALPGIDVVVHAAMGLDGPDGLAEPKSAFDVNVKIGRAHV